MMNDVESILRDYYEECDLPLGTPSHKVPKLMAEEIAQLRYEISELERQLER